MNGLNKNSFLPALAMYAFSAFPETSWGCGYSVRRSRPEGCCVSKEKRAKRKAQRKARKQNRRK